MIWENSLNLADGWQSSLLILCCRKLSSRARITRAQMRYVEFYVSCSPKLLICSILADPHNHLHAFGVIVTFLSAEGQEASCWPSQAKFCSGRRRPVHSVERLGTVGRNQLLAAILLRAVPPVQESYSSTRYPGSISRIVWACRGCDRSQSEYERHNPNTEGPHGGLLLQYSASDMPSLSDTGVQFIAGPVAKERGLLPYSEDQPYCVHPSVFEFISTPAACKDIIVLWARDDVQVVHEVITLYFVDVFI